MNRTTEIIEYLSKPDTANELIVAPNAPPVIRTNDNISIAINKVFDMQDVIDTLDAFKTKALARTSYQEKAKSGSFSFGIRTVGRFRVNYLTQRGSLVMVIMIIPSTIPSIKQLCNDSAMADIAISTVSSGKPGLIAICGTNDTTNSMFTYSMLQHVNETKKTIIYALEDILTFLMSYDNSIIMQCELSTDVDSITDGINNASLFKPDIMYVGNIKPSDDFPEIINIIENGTLVIISSVLLTGEEITEKYYPKNIHSKNIKDMTNATFIVAQGEENKLLINYSNNHA